LVWVDKPFDLERLIEGLGKVDDEGRVLGSYGNSLLDRKAEAERREILETMKRCRGDREEAAKALGISKATLYRRIRRYDLEV
jgi:transcriptional regulator of acetoin/glycerol metabolism